MVATGSLLHIVKAAKLRGVHLDDGCGTMLLYGCLLARAFFDCMDMVAVPRGPMPARMVMFSRKC
jgi:hypothetical protein